jgi:hypothetical protein
LLLGIERYVSLRLPGGLSAQYREDYFCLSNFILHKSDIALVLKYFVNTKAKLWSYQSDRKIFEGEGTFFLNFS